MAGALENLARAQGAFSEAERMLAAMYGASAVAQSRLREMAIAAALKFPSARGEHEQFTPFVKEMARGR
jgi:hypothetical protein